MSWLVSIVIALATAVVGTVASGYVASLSADWYRVSSFEGKSGFMVVGIALAGGLASFVLALVVCRVVAAWPEPGALKALALSMGLVIALAGTAAGAARWLADVPPRIDGDELLLAVEFRFPLGHAGPGTGDAREWAVRLGSVSGRTMRASTMGPLWKEDARQEEGRWIVPGAVEVFTSRGGRTLDIVPEGIADKGFLVPLPRFPGKSTLEWSDWLPHARQGEPPLPEGMRYRFKVVPRSQRVRTEQVGPFEIATVARSFTYLGQGGDGTPYQADADFLIRHRGQSVTIRHRPNPQAEPADASSPTFDRASAVAVLPGAPPSLLVFVMDGYDSGHYYLLRETDGQLQTEYVASGPRSFAAFRLTSDAAVFARARDIRPLVGRVDRGMYAEGGLYLISGAVLDATRGTVKRVPSTDTGPIRQDRPPVALSPDERSYARLGFDKQSAETPALHVIDSVSGEAYAVPIDVARTRFTSLEAVDPAWVAHYFAWTRGENQVDRLAARADAMPMPYRGRLTTDTDGYREYRLLLAGQEVADVLLEFLKTEFQAEPPAKKEYVNAYEARVSGRVVTVMIQDDARVVSLWMERGTDTSLVAEIAKRFDEALATGRYDAAFGPRR